METEIKFNGDNLFYLVVQGELKPLTLEEGRLKELDKRGFKSLGGILLIAGYDQKTHKPYKWDLNRFEGCIIQKVKKEGIQFKAYSVDIKTLCCHFLEHGGSFKEYKNYIQEVEKDLNIKVN